MISLKDKSYSDLYSLRCAAKSILDDLSEMSTTYNIVHGEKAFYELPEEMQKIIEERQEFYSYVQKLNDVLKEKVREVFRD